MPRRNPPNPAKYAAAISETITDARRLGIGSGRIMIRRRLRTIIEGSGWRKRSPHVLTSIASTLSDQNVFADHDLTDPTLPLSTWIKLSDQPFALGDQSRLVVTEAALNRFIRTYHHSVFEGIEGLENLELVGHEKRVRFGEQTRRIDLLFRDPVGTNVVMELERGDPKDDSPMQLRRYMDAIAATGKPVRGVLITARPRSAQLEEDIMRELDEMQSTHPNRWFWYDTDITLRSLR